MDNSPSEKKQSRNAIRHARRRAKRRVEKAQVTILEKIGIEIFDLRNVLLPKSRNHRSNASSRSLLNFCSILKNYEMVPLGRAPAPAICA